MPEAMRFWTARKNTTTGSVNSADDAMIAPQSVPNLVLNVAEKVLIKKARVFVSIEDAVEGHDKIEY